MENHGSRFFRGLYAIEHLDKSVYVGLTYNYKHRYNGHMTGKGATAILLQEKFKIFGHTFVTYGVFYPIEIAGQKESELIDQYRNNGWSVLNKAKAGSLGGNSTIGLWKPVKKMH